MQYVREFRGGPFDGHTEPIQKVETGPKYAGFQYSTDAPRVALYRRAESARTGDYEYHFYDFIKSVTAEEGGKALNELEYGKSGDS